MLSATDLAQVESWRAQGIPVEVVCRGLRQGVERFQAQRGEDATIPGSLSYFDSSVLALVAAGRPEPMRGAPTETRRRRDGLNRANSAEPTQPANRRLPDEKLPDEKLPDETGPTLESELGAAMGRLTVLNDQATDHPSRAAYAAAWACLAEPEAWESPFETLNRADQARLDEWLRSCAPETRATVERQIEAQLDNERPRLGVRGAAVRRRVLLDDLLETEYGLRRLLEEDDDLG